MDSNPRVDVIYRADKKTGEPIAVFPGLAGTNDPNTCTYFVVNGGHSHGELSAIMAQTKPGDDEESMLALDRVLTSSQYRYNLRHVYRATRKHYRERLAQCR